MLPRTFFLGCRLLPALCLAGCLGLLFFYRLGDRDLWSSHEARAAQDAQSILDSGDWLLPRLFDRRPDLQKPPLYYWLVAAVARLRGGPVDGWAVRLPSALAAVGCVLLIVLFGRLRGRPFAGLAAGVILATALHFTWLARVGRIDMPLTFALTAALLGYYQGQCRREGAWKWFLLGYLALAAAVLLKGPIGLALPAAAVGVHLLARGEFRRPRLLRLAHELGLWWGLPLVAALTLPWFLKANAQTNGELFRVFFWYHNVERGFGGSDRLHAHPWWFYGPRLVFDFLPWSPLLLVGLWFFLRRSRLRHDGDAAFGLAWLAGMVVLLSCMRFKRADYLLPAYPGAALFLASLADRWRQGRSEPTSAPSRLPAAFGLVPAACCLLCAAGWWFYLGHVLPGEEEGKGYRGFARKIREVAPAPQPVILFRTKPHALTFHLGRPVDTLLEWENLNWWANRPGCFYVVMPDVMVKEWPSHVHGGGFREVFRSTDFPGGRQERPLVLLRTCPPAESRSERTGLHARANPAAPDRRRAPEPAAGRLE